MTRHGSAQRSSAERCRAAPSPMHTNNKNKITGEDPFTLEVWGSLIVTNAVFWGVGSIYSYFDVTSTPKFLRKYKIQPGTNEPVDPKKFKQLVQTVFINTFIFGKTASTLLSLTFFFHLNPIN